MTVPGALTEKEIKKIISTTKKAYWVYSATNVSNFPRKEIKLTKLSLPPAHGWIDGTYGHIFDNYFHALAYALKVKEQRLPNDRTYWGL